LAGGIPLHLVKLLEEPQFLETFTRKGRFKALIERMPIHLITTRAAVVRAAAFGRQSLSDLRDCEKTRAPLASVQFA
jgi:glucokinase